MSEEWSGPLFLTLGLIAFFFQSLLIMLHMVKRSRYIALQPSRRSANRLYQYRLLDPLNGATTIGTWRLSGQARLMKLWGLLDWVINGVCILSGTGCSLNVCIGDGVDGAAIRGVGKRRLTWSSTLSGLSGHLELEKRDYSILCTKFQFQRRFRLIFRLTKSLSVEEA